MDSLIGIPHEQGLQILKDELFSTIKKFQLLDEDKNSFFSGDNHSIYFDDNGVLTIIYVIPKDEHLTDWNYYVRVLSDDNKIIAEIPLESPIKWVKNVGGEQVVKIAVSGEPTSTEFKLNDYITPTEANELFLQPLIANTNLNIVLQNKLIEKGIILNG